MKRIASVSWIAHTGRRFARSWSDCGTPRDAADRIFQIMRDTSSDALRVRDDIVRRMPPAQRLRLALELSEAIRDLALAQLRRASPELDERALVGELLRRRYASEVLPPELR